MTRILQTLFAWAWDLQEGITVRVARLEQVGPDDRTVLRLRIGRYQGRDFVLRDGTRVAHGALYGEIHFRNAALRALHAQASSPRRVGFLFRDSLIQGLRDLAVFAEEDPRCRSVEAFGGVSMLHYGAEKLGFDVKAPRRGLFARLVYLYQELLTARYHPAGWARVRQGTRVRDSREIWISKAELLGRWGANSQELAQPGEPEAGGAQPLDDQG